MTRIVSYSQYNVWSVCPLQWKLLYVDGLAPAIENIHFVFGDAMHIVVQAYLKTMFQETKKAANELNLDAMLKDEMQKSFLKRIVIEDEKKVFPATLMEMNEFYQDGVEILSFLKRKSAKFFSKRDWELVSIEEPLKMPITDGLTFAGFIDVVLKHKKKNTYKIIDLKTSTRGWGKYTKRDKRKTNQILIYKKFYAKKHNVSEDDISVEFLILKRKIDENAEFYIPRISKFSPAYGKISTKRAIKSFQEFVSSCFKADGSYKLSSIKATPSKQACRFCHFSDKPEHCQNAYKDEQEKQEILKG